MMIYWDLIGFNDDLYTIIAHGLSCTGPAGRRHRVFKGQRTMLWLHVEAWQMPIHQTAKKSLGDSQSVFPQQT